MELEVVIRPRRGGSFELKVEAEGANLTGTVNPVPVSLTIGEDAGSTLVRAEFEDDDDQDDDDDDHDARKKATRGSV